MSDIKAIQTEYAGHRFRSRLEARWVVFFDALGIKWHYEEEGYEFSFGRYLPDFRLESTALYGAVDLWCEVKGQLPHPELVRLCKAALELPRKRPKRVCPTVLILGQVPPPGEPAIHARIDAHPDGLFSFHFVHFMSLDGRRGAYTRPIGDGHTYSLDLLEEWTEERTGPIRESFVEPQADLFLRVDPEVDDAYRAARSARFEFGQSGAL